MMLRIADPISPSRGTSMSAAMTDFLAAFRPLPDRVRGNASDQEIRPYVRPVQSAIHALQPPRRDEAFRLVADLAETGPLPAIGLASLLCGVFVENGGTVAIGAPAIIAAARRA